MVPVEGAHRFGTDAGDFGEAPFVLYGIDALVVSGNGIRQLRITPGMGFVIPTDYEDIVQSLQLPCQLIIAVPAQASFCIHVGSVGLRGLGLILWWRFDIN